MMASTSALAFLISLFLAPSLAGAAEPLKTLSQKLKESLQEKKQPAIAVLNFTYPRGRLSTGSYLVSERLVTYLVQSRAEVLERRLIQAVLEEKKMWESGVIDPHSLKTVGSLLGAEAVLVGTLVDLSDHQTEVMARLIRLDTGKVLAGASTVIPRTWLDGPRLPAYAQGRAPVPGASVVLSVLPPKEVDLDKEPSRTNADPAARQNSVSGKYKLADVDPDKKRPRYRPAPVPFFIPSSARRLGHGPVR